jgi:hypothetical protein
LKAQDLAECTPDRVMLLTTVQYNGAWIELEE